ncbi:MAG: hypothetical protein AABM30_03795 [Actinomycetota bacterium]
MPLRLTVAGTLALLALTVGAQTATAAALKAPKNVKGFLLRVNEAGSTYDRTFSRTPAFTWSPVAGAKRYAFELTTSSTFAPSGTVWSGVTASAAPVISPNVSLPWITGSPYSLYARVQAIGVGGLAGPESAPYGFNMRWRDKPRPLDPQSPGLVRWTPVEGATAYEVWLYGAGQTFLTTTNVADEREFYGSLTGDAAVTWRVRAVRKLDGATANGLPRVSFGPWSDEFTNVNPPFQVGELNPVATVSDIISTPANPRAHELTPGFVFTGNYRSWGLPASLDQTTELFHVYVSTDGECVNRVYVGAVVGGPAYAPRLGKYFSDGPVLMRDGTPVTSVDSGGLGGFIDLWDSSWPGGGYYWTVIPLMQGPGPYTDIQLPEDVCRAGGAVRFGKLGRPVVTGDSSPFVSGLSPDGKLVGAKSLSQQFYGFPLVAWQPVYSAQAYEVQWSRTLNPWRPGSLGPTPATSAALPLPPGRWYYRVRGLNYSLPVRPEMTWSKPVVLHIAKPRFKIVRR